MHRAPYNPACSNKMTQKLQSLRQKNQSQIENDTSSNLIALLEKFTFIEHASMDMYGQRQLTYMMKSNFFEQSLVTSGFSIKDFIKAGQDLSAHNIKEQLTFETVISRA